MRRALLAAATAAILAGCSTTEIQPRHWVQTHYAGQPVACFPSEGAANFTANIEVPARYERAQSFFCEHIQGPDYAPCRLLIVADSVDVWCAFIPGTLWRQSAPGVEL